MRSAGVPPDTPSRPAGGPPPGPPGTPPWPQVAESLSQLRTQGARTPAHSLLRHQGPKSGQSASGLWSVRREKQSPHRANQTESISPKSLISCLAASSEAPLLYFKSTPRDLHRLPPPPASPGISPPAQEAWLGGEIWRPGGQDSLSELSARKPSSPHTTGPPIWFPFLFSSPLKKIIYKPSTTTHRTASSQPPGLDPRKFEMVPHPLCTWRCFPSTEIHTTHTHPKPTKHKE